MADDNVVVAAPEPSEDQRELLSARYTTVEEEESNAWAAGENRRHEDTRAIMQKLRGLTDAERYLYTERYRPQIDALTAEVCSALKDKPPGDIGAYLEEVAEAERDGKRQQEALDKQAAEAAEAQFNETPALRDIRHRMKSSVAEVAAIDKELSREKRLEALGNDPTGPDSDELMTPEEYRLAREGLLPSRSAKIQALELQRQSKLMEAQIHQNAYYEEARTNQAPATAPPSQAAMVQIVDNNGQPMMQMTAAQYEGQQQINRDIAAHQQRMQEAGQRYGLANWEQATRQSAQAWRQVGEAEKAYIRSFPNSADIEFVLSSHPQAVLELAALSRQSSLAAVQAINGIAVNLGLRQGATPAAPKATSAPKPPVPVTGSSTSRAFNPYDESISTDEWFAKRTRDVERRRNRHS